ncbi:WG repeat-containing protein [Parafilimonas sp.]|uniref:WG repeat-containing protein n=1 Tax=Parafilimonas sp. TaxID=1969739 RepID=UPI0039E2CDBB
MKRLLPLLVFAFVMPAQAQKCDKVFADAQRFHNGLAAVMKNGRYGYIDIKGNTVIDFRFSNARTFADGLAPASDEKGLWGYINGKGDFIISPEYNFADSFDNNEARVIKGSSVYFIDKNNKKLHE